MKNTLKFYQIIFKSHKIEFIYQNKFKISKQNNMEKSRI